MFGPVFWSELTRTARRQRHIWVRALYGGLLLAVLWISYYSVFRDGQMPHSQVTMNEMAAFAEQFFYSFAFLQLAVSLLVTMAVTAGTIAEERDRRTIEYLFVTHLSNGEIVLDKLAVRLLHVLCLLLAALPVLALSMLFGGVGLGPLVELTVLTLGTVVGTACLSVYVSVTMRRTRDAMMSTVLLLVAVLAVPAVVRESLQSSNLVLAWWAYDALDQLCELNPFIYLFERIVMSSSGSQVDTDALFTFVRNAGLASAFFLALAVMQVRRTHLKAASRSSTRNRSTSRLFRVPAVSDRPVLWKELFAERFIQREHRWSTWVAPVGLLLVAASIGAFYYLALYEYRDLQPHDFLDAARNIEPILGCIFVLLVGARAAVSICHEREQSTWDTLLTTTLDPHEIVLAKMAGSLYVLRGLLIVYLIVWILEIPLDGAEWWRGAGVLMTTLLLGVFFSALGVLISQRTRTSTRAMCWVVGLAVLLGGAYLLIAMPLAMFFLRYELAPIVIVPCLIFLEGFWAWFDPQQTFTEISPLTVYIVGILFYSAATVALVAVNLLSFERTAREAGPRRYVVARPRTDVVKVESLSTLLEVGDA